MAASALTQHAEKVLLVESAVFDDEDEFLIGGIQLPLEGNLSDHSLSSQSSTSEDSFGAEAVRREARPQFEKVVDENGNLIVVTNLDAAALQYIDEQNRSANDNDGNNNAQNQSENPQAHVMNINAVQYGGVFAADGYSTAASENNLRTQNNERSASASGNEDNPQALVNMEICDNVSSQQRSERSGQTRNNEHKPYSPSNHVILHHYSNVNVTERLANLAKEEEEELRRQIEEEDENAKLDAERKLKMFSGGSKLQTEDAERTFTMREKEARNDKDEKEYQNIKEDSEQNDIPITLVDIARGLHEMDEPEFVEAGVVAEDVNENSDMADINSGIGSPEHLLAHTITQSSLNSANPPGSGILKAASSSIPPSHGSPAGKFGASPALGHIDPEEHVAREIKFFNVNDILHGDNENNENILTNNENTNFQIGGSSGSRSGRAKALLRKKSGEMSSPEAQLDNENDAASRLLEQTANISAPSLHPIHGSSSSSTRTENPNQDFRCLLGSNLDYEKMVLFVDYDGTLRDFEDEPQAATPTEEIYHLLAKLTDLKDRVRVVIISGRDAVFLENYLGVNQALTLVAEHGYQVKKEEQWLTLGQTADDKSGEWKDIALEQMRKLSNISGCFVEEKAKSLVWHYRAAQPPEEGDEGAETLAELLELVGYPTERVSRGHKMVEVFGPKGPTKGECIQELIPGFCQEDFCDCKKVLVVAAGDDVTDETMFGIDLSELPERVEERIVDFVTIKIGNGKTAARWRISSPSDFRRLLHTVVHTFHTMEHEGEASATEDMAYALKNDEASTQLTQQQQQSASTIPVNPLDILASANSKFSNNSEDGPSAKRAHTLASPMSAGSGRSGENIAGSGNSSLKPTRSVGPADRISSPVFKKSLSNPDG